MLVIDASVIVDAYGGHAERARAARRALREPDLVAPAHLDLESISGWRRHVLNGEMTVAAGADALAHLKRSRIRRLPLEQLLTRIWELRENLTAQDAAYVALAERLQARLATCDARLTRATGPRCEFMLIS